MRILENRANRHGELFAASPAFVNALADFGFARRFGLELVNGLFFVVLAMRADCAVRPKQRFQQATRPVIVAVFLRQRYQVQLVTFFSCFHGIKVTRLLLPVKYFRDTLIIYFCWS